MRPGCGDPSITNKNNTENNNSKNKREIYQEFRVSFVVQLRELIMFAFFLSVRLAVVILMQLFAVRRKRPLLRGSQSSSRSLLAAGVLALVLAPQGGQGRRHDASG